MLGCDVLCSFKLFRGVLKWGKAQLPRRDQSSVERLSDVVSSLLGHIRFPHMSVKERSEAVLSGYVVVDSLYLLNGVVCSIVAPSLMQEILHFDAGNLDVRFLSFSPSDLSIRRWKTRLASGDAKEVCTSV